MSKINELHYRYWIGFLLLTCVIVISVKWGTIDELMKYLTFALTLSSLILAVLAIVYSFISNSQISRNISKIEVSSIDISSSADKIDAVIVGLKEHIASLPEMIASVDENVQRTHARLDELNVIGPSTDATHVATITYDWERFFSTCSSVGIYCLYAANLSKDSGIPIKYMELFKTVLFSSEYAYGFYIACASVGLINYTMEDQAIKVTYLQEEIVTRIEGLVTQRIEKIKTAEVKQEVHDQIELLKSTLIITSTGA